MAPKWMVEGEHMWKKEKGGNFLEASRIRDHFPWRPSVLEASLNGIWHLFGLNILPHHVPCLP